jgi:catechol 2,3-dioxygenase-like lactoylglutathione lyase family enzyme
LFGGRPSVTKILGIMPVLKVADIQRSIEWYTGVLGFQANGRFVGDGDGEGCFIQADGTELLLTTGSHLGGAPSFTGTLYFRVVGVDPLFARVSGRPEVVWPLEQQDYGTREFGIRDPDGYVLAFAEESPPEA